MAKAIKTYAGGINFKAQAAIRADGVIFMRVQERTRFGLNWTPWKERGVCDPANPPATIPCGFSDLRPANYYDAMDNVRLPNNA